MKINTSSLTFKIFMAMVLGLFVGLLLRLGVSETTDLVIPLGLFDFSVKAVIVDGFLHAGGQIFINSLKMLVVPLVFVSLVCGTCSLSDPQKLGRLGGKSVLLYVATTAIAISFACAICSSLASVMPTIIKFLSVNNCLSA